MQDSERDRRPAAPHDGGQLGGLTGATGNLTPDDPGAAFIPAETREVTDPASAGELTAAAHRRREERNARLSDEPGHLRARGERTAPNDRDGGYGSEHGLAANDPAYREEEHLPPPRVTGPGSGSGSAGPTRLGGDVAGSPEDEHL
jgi:hypothetical protein